MTIDTSNLSQEKRAFLKVNPELLKSIEQAIPKQVMTIQKRKEKRKRGLSKLQRDLEDVGDRARAARRKADKLRRKHHIDPHLREIQQEMERKAKGTPGKNALVCPVCGEVNGAWCKGKPNIQNGRPWCLKCNSPLVPYRKLKRWKKMYGRVNATPRTSLKDEFKQRELDF